MGKPQKDEEQCKQDDGRPQHRHASVLVPDVHAQRLAGVHVLQRNDCVVGAVRVGGGSSGCSCGCGCGSPCPCPCPWISWSTVVTLPVRHFIQLFQVVVAEAQSVHCARAAKQLRLWYQKGK